MPWEAIGALGQIAGAIAVIATLYFLSKQISLNARELERSNQHQSAHSTMSNNALYVQIWQPLMQDEDLATIYLKAIRGEMLNETEAFRFAVYANTFLALAEAAFYQTASGVGFEELSQERTDVIEILAPYLKKILTTEAGRRWFTIEAPALFTSEFLAVVATHITPTK